MVKPRVTKNLTRSKKKKNNNHWKEILRDERGRWIKGKRRIQKSVNESPSQLIPSSPPSFEEEDVNDFSCPRCGGEMKNRPIRCGPERIIHVHQCMICNFYIPIT